MKQNDDGKTVAAMDCLVPGIGESSEEARGRTTTGNSAAEWRTSAWIWRITASIWI